MADGKAPESSHKYGALPLEETDREFQKGKLPLPKSPCGPGIGHAKMKT
jgi:hypothetical protein